MGKTLKATQPNKCIGCELCTLEAQRQLKKVGLEEALIRIFRNVPEQESGQEETSKNISHSVDIDPRINVLDIEKIKNICPKDVFEITEND